MYIHDTRDPVSGYTKDLLDLTMDDRTCREQAAKIRDPLLTFLVYLAAHRRFWVLALGSAGPIQEVQVDFNPELGW